jgi:hypothetical protein
VARRDVLPERIATVRAIADGRRPVVVAARHPSAAVGLPAVVGQTGNGPTGIPIAARLGNAGRAGSVRAGNARGARAANVVRHLGAGRVGTVAEARRRGAIDRHAVTGLASHLDVGTTTTESTETVGLVGTPSAEYVGR